jgi:hypothetical protein
MRRLIFPILALALAILACIPLPDPTPPASLKTQTYTPPGLTGPTETMPLATVNIVLYLTDVARYQVGTEPYESAVMRTVPASAWPPEAVLTQLFLGPTEAEEAQGLAVFLSGTTGFSNLTIENGIARVYLTGICGSQGSTYTIANLIAANFRQFPEIQWIKIYDQNNETEVPDGESDSIPFCLEP